MIHTTQGWKIGDCIELMREMPPESVDLVVTDPPYGYSFMGKEWDKAVPPVNVWQECLRILKPGAFAFIMSAPRQDVLAHNLVNLSDAGFETGFTSIYWTFASGFPKAGNISKMVDKRLGVEREITSGESKPPEYTGKFDNRNSSTQPKDNGAATPQAKELDGSYAGFQPKPAVEVILVVMKPLSEKTYVDQALANGKGVTWLDDGRIPYRSDKDMWNEGVKTGLAKDKFFTHGKQTEYLKQPDNQGRFPANLLVSDDGLNNGKSTCSSDAIKHNNQHVTSGKGIYGAYKQKDTYGYSDSGSFSRYFNLDAWMDERIKQLPKEAQKTFPFMIVPKASKSEKGGDNRHPTVKPVKLFSWLMTIGSRDGDLICDPFLGSGTALEAGCMTNRNVIGFEIDPQWASLYSKRSKTHTPPLTAYCDKQET